MQSASIERERQGQMITGTLAYMAPEQRDGTQPPSPRSDLFSIGVMLFEMLTGERPAGAELPSTLRAEVPAGLDDIFRRLYSRFESRYTSAEAVLTDLERIVPRRAGGLTPPPVPVARGGRNGRAFRYEARDPHGHTVAGEVAAAARTRWSRGCVRTVTRRCGSRRPASGAGAGHRLSCVRRATGRSRPRTSSALNVERSWRAKSGGVSIAADTRDRMTASVSSAHGPDRRAE